MAEPGEAEAVEGLDRNTSVARSVFGEEECALGDFLV